MQRNVVVSMSALLATLSVPLGAAAEDFNVAQDGKSKASFVSDAVLETIKGVTSQVHGRLSIDPNNLGASRGRLEVPVRSLRTGIDLRDEHLRGDGWLDAANHPNIVFELTGVGGPTSLPANELVRLTLRGKLTIHGVTKNITAEARVRYMPSSSGDVIRAKARFSIKLEDYGVSVPLPVRLKVSNELQIKVDLRAIAQ